MFQKRTWPKFSRHKSYLLSGSISRAFFTSNSASSRSTSSMYACALLYKALTFVLSSSRTWMPELIVSIDAFYNIWWQRASLQYLCAEFLCFSVFFQFQLAGCVVELATDFQSFWLLLLILTERAVILNVFCSLIEGKMELVMVRSIKVTDILHLVYTATAILPSRIS